MVRMFTLSGVTPSQNVWDKMHWAERHELRLKWFLEVFSSAGLGHYHGPAHVRICRVSKRLIDLQNIGSPTKPILDALVHFGWLRGDGPKDVLEFTTTQRKCDKGEEPHMEVAIFYESPKLQGSQS